jgi:hypothetical protein
LGLGGFIRGWQSGWLVGKLTLKMRGKDLIIKHKKAPPFLRARADYENGFLLKILHILHTEERK